MVHHGVVFNFESIGEVFRAIGRQTAVLKPINRLKTVVLETYSTMGHESSKNSDSSAQKILMIRQRNHGL